MSSSKPYAAASAAPNLRMRKVVDMLAAKRPAPMATASSASRWVSSWRPPSASVSAALIPGTRVAPPIISTTSTSLRVML